jgi:tetratricopeptide (TPR) repeat protein
MNELGNGLLETGQNEDALSVKEAELAMKRRLGASEDSILSVQGNLAGAYLQLGRKEQASRMLRDVYSGYLRLYGTDHRDTLREAYNYANTLNGLQRFAEAKALMRRTMPVARRVLGENDEATLRMRWCYARALYRDAGATLDDLREAATTLEDAERIARRVFGGAHPLTTGIGKSLQTARAALRARETPSES